ncbi:MAG: hypothetical protein ACR2RB_21325 [Gammaproteobacteria bacterium]
MNATRFGYVPARRTALFLLLWIALAAVAGAQELDPSQSELNEMLRVKIRSVQQMALNPVIVRAVRLQNLENLTVDEINRRDDTWRGSDELTPFMLSLQTSEAGRFLQQQVSRSRHFNEAFATDNQGANVAAFPATSDYWQGDEEKWIASFDSGKGRVFIGPLELDESTKSYAAQISAPILHRRATIGVLVVGVTIYYLEVRQRLSEHED